jgi:WD40 repeat protein
VLAICPLPGQQAAVAGGSGAVTIISAGPGGPIETGPVLHGPAGPVRSLCPVTYPSGRALLAAAGNDATIWVWDAIATEASAQDGSRTTVPDRNQARYALTGHAGWIWSLTAVSAGADHTVRLWDPAAGRALGRPLTGHTDQVRAVIAAVSADGRVVLVSGGHDGTVRLWDCVTGTPRAIIPLGIPVHALLQQRPNPASLERTGGGATITVGMRSGIGALDLHRDMFPG